MADAADENGEALKRAIILVPGFQRKAQLEARDELVQSILNYSDGFQKTGVEKTDDGEGVSLARIAATDRQSGDRTVLDIFEVYWADLIPDWSADSPASRFWKATDLLSYWFLGDLAKSVLRGRFPSRTAVTLVVMGVILVIWYISVAMMFLAAVQTSGLPSWVLEWLGGLGSPQDWSAWAQALTGSALVVFLLGLLGLGNLNHIADLSRFVKLYLGDERLGPENIGVRAQTKGRLVTLLDHVSRSAASYDEIVIVSHSLGGAIAVDALAEYGRKLEIIRLHTWGTAMGALAAQSPLISREIEKLCKSRTQLKDWRDVVFSADVMASEVPFPKEHAERFPPVLRPQMPKGRLFSPLKLHEDYFRCEDAVLPLLQRK
ncbi:alpha/beta hydrolase [Rhodobacterales bacterium]|nr:alpha/beta hydrolase [Rhodobacterales bacterium]